MASNGQWVLAHLRGAEHMADPFFPVKLRFGVIYYPPTADAKALVLFGCVLFQEAFPEFGLQTAQAQQSHNLCKPQNL